MAPDRPRLPDPPTPTDEGSDEDASPTERALAWALQLEGIELARAARRREDRRGELWRACTDLLKSRPGQLGALVLAVAVAVVIVSAAGVDPELGRAYDAAAHWATGCPVAHPHVPAPAVPLPVLQPVTPPL